MFDKRVDCKEGSDSCTSYGSEGQSSGAGAPRVPDIRRVWVYNSPTNKKQREIMICADEGQTQCVKGQFTERRTKDGAYVGVSILQNQGNIPNLPAKLLVSFSTPGGTMQPPFQLVVYKDAKDDGVGWSTLYMGKCDFAEHGNIAVPKDRARAEKKKRG